VANAAHELRTPLTINRTLIDVALDSPDTAESTRRLGAKLLAVNQRHERLIDGLLMLASSDQQLVEHSPVDLAGIAQHVTAMSEHAARDAGVEIRTALAPAPMIGDPVLLERLAQNLLDNAIRYNLAEQGWVSITAGTVDGHACLTVENTGTSVPEDEIPELFEPFRRLSSTDRLADLGRSSHERGAGLGLSIVRSVAHAHGGDVHAWARPDGGLTIRVRVPTRRG
jgi:signal transduction histidine kinase